MSVSPEDPVDHERVIALLARKSTLPIDEVTRLYELEWAGFQACTRRIPRSCVMAGTHSMNSWHICAPFFQ